MDPRDPSVLDELEREERLEADHYYDAMRMGWLTSDADEDVESDPTPVGPPRE